jgi:hypothetical protein
VATGLAVTGTGFEVLAGNERIGPWRSLSAADVEFLAGLAGRYVRAVRTRAADAVFVALGRELFGWLDGQQGHLSALLATHQVTVTIVERTRTVEVRGLDADQLLELFSGEE